MDDIFKHILDEIKKLLLQPELPEKTAPQLARLYEATALIWEQTMDHRIEKVIGKTQYEELIALVEGGDAAAELMLSRLGKKDLPN